MIVGLRAFEGVEGGAVARGKELGIVPDGSGGGLFVGRRWLGKRGLND